VLGQAEQRGVGGWEAGMVAVSERGCGEYTGIEG
jgi:hypothetical protein